MKSIGQYLSTRIICGASLVLATGSLLLGLAIRHLDIREFDQDLETKARLLATLVVHDGILTEADFSADLLPEFNTSKNAEYFQFRFLDGATIRRSKNLKAQDLPFLSKSIKNPLLRNTHLPDGRSGRFIQLTFQPRAMDANQAFKKEKGVRNPDDSESALVVLGVARSREGLDALLLSVYAALVFMDILLISLIVLLVRHALRKAFRPVALLNAQIANLSPECLEARIDLPDTPDEIASVPSTLNEFMATLQAAFVREQRFASDAAHELRTPVAEFRAACEVGARWSDDPALVKRRFENLRTAAANMERMLNGLLDLSRLERGTDESHRADIRLAFLIDSCWARVSNNDGAAKGHLENRVAQSLVLHSDEAKLEMLLYNILDNAASYSPLEANVTCDGKQSEDGALEIIINNPAQGLRSEDIEHIFERFWRKDAARTAGTHAGLGLSIVKALADALAIRVTIELTPEHIFSVRLRFPAQMAK